MNKQQYGLFTLLIVAALFMGSVLFLPAKTHAAVFNDAANGDWNLGATWGNPGNNVVGSGYPGSSDTVTIDSHTVTLTADQVASTVTISGGTLNGGSSTLTVSFGWTYTSGTFNPQSGTVKLTGTQTFTGNTTFNNLTIDTNSSSQRTFTLTGYTATTTGTFTLNNASSGTITLTGGTIAVHGDVVWDAPNAATSNTTVLNVVGTGDQTITSTGATSSTGGFMSLVIDKPSGTLYLSGTFRTGRSWTLTSGTLDATTNSTTVVFAGAALSIVGSQTFHNLSFYASASSINFTISSGSVLTVAETLTIDSTGSGTANVNTGTIIALGDMNINNLRFSGTANLLISGSENQLLTSSNSSVTTGDFASTTVNKTGGTLTVSGIVRTSRTFRDFSGGTDWTTNDSTLAFTAGQGFTPGNTTYHSVYIGTAGDTTLNGDLTLEGDFTNRNDFVTGSNTVTFAGSGTSTLITGGSVTDDTDFQNITVNKTGNGVVQVSGYPLDVDGTLTITSGTFDLNGQPLTGVDTINNSGTFKLAGYETVAVSPTNNSGSIIEYAATTTATQAIKNWTYQSLKFSGDSGGTFTDATSRTLSGELIVTGGTFAPTATLTVTATTTVSGGTFNASGSTLDLNSDVVISGGTFTAPSGTMTASGNFTHSGGTFTHSDGTVTLDGADQSITGSTTWNNLTKTVLTARTLTFDHAATQTIEGTLTLEGASENLLSLRSSSSGQQWEIDPQGIRVVNYLDVSDSNNINDTMINTTSHNITLTGDNNTGWGDAPEPPLVSMTAPADGATVAGNAVTLSATASDDSAVAGVQFKYNTNTNIGSEDTSSAYSVAWDTTGLSDGEYELIAVARDDDDQYATSTTVTVTVDNTAPVRSSGSPTTNIAAGFATTLSLDTNEVATCKYATSTGIAFGSMTVFVSTASTTHSTPLTRLAAGTTHNYYVKCQDAQANTNSTDYTISFTSDSYPADPTFFWDMESEIPDVYTGDTTVFHYADSSLSTDYAATGSQSLKTSGFWASATFDNPTNNAVWAPIFEGTIEFDWKYIAPWTEVMLFQITGKCDPDMAPECADDPTMDTNDGIGLRTDRDDPGEFVSSAQIQTLDLVDGHWYHVRLSYSHASSTLIVDFDDERIIQNNSFSASSYTTHAWHQILIGNDLGTNALQYIDNFAICPRWTDDCSPVAADTTAPAISSIASSTTSTTATISWTTDESATSTVSYGLTSGYGTASSSASLTTSHSITLTGLTPSTTYHFQVSSGDSSYNYATSSDYTFTTSAAADTTGPVISTVSAGDPGETSVTITWTTDESSDSQVNYGLTSTYTASTTLDASLSTSHSVTVSGLSADTTYHFRVRSSDASGNLTVSSDYSFTTDAADPEVQQVSSISNGAPVGSLDGSGWSLLNEPKPRLQIVYSDGRVVYLDEPSEQQSGQVSIPSQQASVSTQFALTSARDLEFGKTGNDIKQLQMFLNKYGFIVATKGPGSPGNETSYFGPATRAALIKFQKTYNIKPAAGYFGPITKGVVLNIVKN